MMAGLAAVLLVPAWVAVWVFGAPLTTQWPPTLWHAHEMVFGFIAAAVAGFLLTAVPSWTGQRGFAGLPLVILVAVWLCGRIFIATGAFWSPLLVLTVDVAFLVTLAVLIAPPLLRAGNRNTPLLLVLLLLAGCNVAFHVSLLHRNPAVASHWILIAIDIALLLVTVIGGRILPAFTTSGLKANGIGAKMRTLPWIGQACIAAMLGVIVVDALSPDSRAAGVLAGLVAILQAARLLQWRSGATLRTPILWVLHLGYAWLPVGFALKCAAFLGGFAASAFWLHALTIGVLATMIMGVMTRAALGHSGRPLVASPLIVAAYWFLLLAALIRVFGLGVIGLNYVSVLVLSALFWTAAFALFLLVYIPILWLPRADGKAG